MVKIKEIEELVMTDQEIVKKVVAAIEKLRADTAREEKLRKERNERASRLAAMVVEKTGVNVDDAFWLVGREIDNEEGC